MDFSFFVTSFLKVTLVLCISKDLPFAQHRFCVAEGIEHVMTLSDYRYDSSFGKDYGVLITDSIMKGLLARAVVVINPEGRVIYSYIIKAMLRYCI